MKSHATRWNTILFALFAFVLVGVARADVVVGLDNGGGGWVEAFRAGSHDRWLRIPWSAYACSVGEAYPAQGDLDGDGQLETIIGLGTYKGQGGWVLLLDDRAAGDKVLRWIRVPWNAYNQLDGSTRPTAGDIDGDGRAEIIVGLGSSGAGWLCVFEDSASSNSLLRWLHVPWSAYNSSNGETRPACGDLDGDGRAELAVGLGQYPTNGGWLALFEDGARSNAFSRWLRLPWGAYNKANGELWPSCGELDGDASDELVLGLGKYTASGGWFAVRDDAKVAYKQLMWRRIPCSAYQKENGETRVACANLDTDGCHELVVGLGTRSSNGGWMAEFDDYLAKASFKAWRRISWNSYNSTGGGTRPAQMDIGQAKQPGLTRNFKFSLPLFAANSAWNQKVTAAKVLPDSDKQLLVAYREMRAQLGNWTSMDVGYDEYTMAVFRAAKTTQKVVLRNYDGNPDWTNPKLPEGSASGGNPNGGGSVTVPAPAGKVRPSGPRNRSADGHTVLYDPDTHLAYDFWQATTARDGSGNSRGGGYEGTAILETGVVDYFDVRGSGSNYPNNYFSARAVGTALLAGLILPEDLESGAIKHALAFATYNPRNTNTSNPQEPFSSDYFYPAVTTEAEFYSTDPYALASGQRLRLKKSLVDTEGNSIDESQLTPVTKLFLTALRTYGAILVDNASGFSFYAEDIHTANLKLSVDQVNQLLGQPAGTALPAGKTKWQVLMEKLNSDLEQLPMAYGPWTDGQNPKTATITVSNFEVVEPAKAP